MICYFIVRVTHEPKEKPPKFLHKGGNYKEWRSNEL